MSMLGDPIYEAQTENDALTRRVKTSVYYDGSRRAFVMEHVVWRRSAADVDYGRVAEVVFADSDVTAPSSDACGDGNIRAAMRIHDEFCMREFAR